MVLAIAGCTGSGGDSGGAGGAGGAAGAGGAGGGGAAAKSATPEDAFASMKAAAMNKDWKAFCQMLTPKSQDEMAGAMVMTAGLMKMFSAIPSGEGGEEGQGGEGAAAMKEAIQKIDALFAKHGIDEAKLSNIDPSAAGADAGLGSLAAAVQDKPSFIGEVMALMESMPNKQGGGPPDFGSATLTDVKIEGDSAQGKITLEGKEEAIHFKKIDGVWRIELPGMSG
jgi:hypothetical protein